jgi:hypothetical protein
MLQVSGFRLTSCDMATRLFQITTLIQTPGEMFLKALMVNRPRFKHAPRAHYPGNAAPFCKHREAVVMRQPDSVIMQNINFPEMVQSFDLRADYALHRRSGR